MVDDIVKEPLRLIESGTAPKYICKFKELVREFDERGNPYAPGYYLEGSGGTKTAWGTPAVSLETMLKKYEEGKYTFCYQVHFDLFVMLWNALCYNPPDHPVAKAARKMYERFTFKRSKGKQESILECHIALESFKCSECHILKVDEYGEEVDDMFQCDYCSRGIHPDCRGAPYRTFENLSPFKELDDHDDGLGKAQCQDFCSAECKSKYGIRAFPQTYHPGWDD